MSRAFVKDADDAPIVEPMAPRGPQPAPITASGLAMLQRLRDASSDPAEHRRLGRIIDDVEVVGPPEHVDSIAFGATVTLAGGSSSPQTYTIVGEDEIDIPSGRIGIGSPLAQALLGARVGDSARWTRPAGDITVTVQSIQYAVSRPLD